MTHQTVDATIEPTQDPSKRYRCRHIFIDGHRCGSPSLRGEHLCYYHHTTLGAADERRHRRTWAEFELPPLEDRSSILAAVTEVLQRIACDNLPVKQAGLLLYGLQIVSNNLPEPDEAKAKSDNQPPVEQVLINPRYGDLAPITEMSEDANTVQTSDQPGAPRPALEDVGEAPQTSQPTTPEPTILPNLNASADIAPPQKHVISTETAGSPTSLFVGVQGEAAAERPLYFSVDAAHPPTTATKPHTTKPEINIPRPTPGTAAWYPNNCHAYEKRTSRPPHSAHRHQAAQRRRSRRRHELDGLQLA
ncbi:hypothetical protein [Edaphobacter dinghuensis]|uniref:hypothetical protein n=1 Tax=Edaphobacter dinghuensis TaxID=1560005 RepID=UPI00166C995F|nr:hypothetical protein [Edaphobacter dinghuensis]